MSKTLDNGKIMDTKRPEQVLFYFVQVTIIPRTSQALGFAQYTPQDKKLYSPEELMDR